jgi:GH35 family endo-1,4-beta-xylanase
VVSTLADILNSDMSTQTPSYVTNITDPEVLKQTLRTHVEAVAGRYKDDWAYLDVINERKLMVYLRNGQNREKADLATLHWAASLVRKRNFQG